MIESAAAVPATSLAAAAAILALGFLFGLKHATEADHIAAVSAIVSERRGWRSAARTGALWGLGHTLSIVIAGLFVLGLHVAIPESMARALEFVVALMIIALGGTALARALRSRPDVHVHAHTHDGTTHVHLHFHGAADRHAPPGGDDRPVPHGPRRHATARAGLKPLVVGVIHGLAGSATLTLLVLARISSVPVGLAYLLVFGAGSIGGMIIMSLAISLPFAATVARPLLHRSIRIAAGALSLGFGLVYAWWQISGGRGA